MPRYFFSLVDGKHAAEDKYGKELDSLYKAHLHALHMFEKLIQFIPDSLSPTCHTDSGRRTRLGFLCGREAGRLVRHESRRQAMARVAGHLSVEDLEAGFRSARDPTAARHFQVIWLLARGHTIADVAAVTSFVPRWIEQLLARYNAHGPE